jgi:hypothetical protein
VLLEEVINCLGICKIKPKDALECQDGNLRLDFKLKEIPKGSYCIKVLHADTLPFDDFKAEKWLAMLLDDE